jgi:hypothetical protein
MRRLESPPPRLLTHVGGRLAIPPGSVCAPMRGAVRGAVAGVMEEAYPRGYNHLRAAFKDFRPFEEILAVTCDAVSNHSHDNLL